MGPKGSIIEKTAGKWRENPVESNQTCFRRGVRDGMPIALGYFAVAFTLGIAAKNAGFSAVQAMVESLTNNASAGEYAVFSLVSAGAGYWEVAVMTLVANARYLLMSCALSQKLAPETGLGHRMLVAFDVTDEIFGVSIAFPGRLNPFYTYGAMAAAIPGWALGTFLGVVVGNVLPLRLVSALSVGLYGMFLAIIVPPARESRVVLALVLLSFAVSWAAASLPALAAVSSGVKTIVLTVAVSLGAAVLFPVEEAET
ncbi:MAG: AzlC family ABC transporter permease [Oscillospiraceae bacterium]|nr:AzlC family ABC transporter permease [Oscillospiraceae bacterium]